jgi:hypothetical protein
MNQAYAWISKSVDNDKKYWTVHLKAKIEATLGMNSEAVTSSRESMALAKEAGNPDYVALNERLIKSLR